MKRILTVLVLLFALAGLAFTQGKWGYIDPSGAMVIAPQFDHVRSFSEGRAAVTKNGNVGFIDTKGVLVIPTQYTDTLSGFSFSEGRAAVQVEKDTWRFIDKSGKTVLDKNFYAFARNFSEGLAPVYIVEFDFGAVFDEYWAYIDTTGTPVISIDGDLETMSPFSEGRAVLSRSDSDSVIDTSNKTIVPFGRYIAIGGYSEGLATMQIGGDRLFGGGKHGYIGLAGEVAIPPSFDDALPFSQGRAVVIRGGLYGIIDKKGAYIAGPQFEDAAFMFSEGLLPVKIGGKWGYCNLDGKIVIRATYEAAWSFKNQRAAVKQNGVWGFINPKGQFVIRPQYEEVLSFSESLAAVRVR